jgi:hypothetical protein
VDLRGSRVVEKAKAEEKVATMIASTRRDTIVVVLFCHCVIILGFVFFLFFLALMIFIASLDKIQVLRTQYF